MAKKGDPTRIRLGLYKPTINKLKGILKSSKTTQSTRNQTFWKKLADDKFLLPTDKQRDIDKGASNYFEFKLNVEQLRIQVFQDSNPVPIYTKTGKKGPSDEEPSHSGFHFLVLHPYQGNVMAQKHFKTSQPEETKVFAEAIRRILPGRLLILICVSYGVFFLDGRTKALLEALGSQSIHHLAVNETWAMIARTPQSHSEHGAEDSFKPVFRGKAEVWLEAATLAARDHHESSPVEFCARVPKRTMPTCEWEKTASKGDLRRFCHAYAGYAEICRCRAPLDPEALRRAGEMADLRERIPVAMLTAINAWHFYRQVLNLLSLKGASETLIFVFVDGFNEEIYRLASLFGLPVHVHRPQGDAGSRTRLNMHFRFSVYNVFALSPPEVTKAIILEDDLLLSPDFIMYFHATSRLLDADPSVYCVNAFSVNSVPSVARDASKLRRANAFPQFGWMITRDWVVTQLPLWAREQDDGVDWDWWLSTPAVKRGRTVIVPEVSRTFHSGSAGAHVTGWEQALFFGAMIYNRDPHVTLQGLDRLQKATYDEDLRKKLVSARLLGSEFNPCRDRLPHVAKGGPSAFKLVVQADSHDYYEHLGFLTVALCVHAYTRDYRDVYEGVQQYSLDNSTLYVVGCPVSPFCLSLGKVLNLLSPGEAAVREAEALDWRWRTRGVRISYLKRRPATSAQEQFHLLNTVVVNRTVA